LKAAAAKAKKAATTKNNSKKSKSKSPSKSAAKEAAAKDATKATKEDIAATEASQKKEKCSLKANEDNATCKDLATTLST